MITSTSQENQLDDNQESIYDILHSNIIDLRLKPGTLMSIKDICEHYGAGRSPVRDALIRLEQEELIVFLPQRGTLISKIDLERVEDQRFLRYSVEENVMKEFMATHTSSDFSQLEALLWEQEACLAKGNTRRFIDFDDAFHRVFYEETNRLYGYNALQNLSGHYRRLRLLSSMDKEIAKKVIVEHKEMLTALSMRDMSLLQDIFSGHLCRVTMQEKILLQRHPELFVQSSAVEERKSSFLDHDYLEALI